MKHSTVDTWLPVFSGFYGTVWDNDSMEETELENINETRREKGLSAINYDAIEWNYDGYRAEVCKGVTGHIVDALKGLGVIVNGAMQKLISPREYNFANDSVNVSFTINAKNVKAIAKYLADNKGSFTEYLKERYTTRSGFLSSYSPNVEAWIGDYLGPVLRDGHKLGAVLNFILLNEEGIDYEWSIYESLTGNGVTLQALNYQELIDQEILVFPNTKITQAEINAKLEVK